MAGTRRLEVVIAGRADGASKAMGQAGKSAGQMQGKMSSAGKVMAASFAGIGVAAVAFAKKSSDTFRRVGMEVGKLSRFTGASVEEASKLRVAFQQSGIGAEQGTKAIGILSKKIVASKDTMKDFGIKTRDASGQIRPMTKILEDAADKIAGTKNATEKLALAQKMFGKGGADMIKVLGGGSAKMRELAAEATRFGLVLTQDNLDAVKKATDATRDQQLAYEGLQLQIGQHVTPAITHMTEIIASEIPKATGFIDDHHGALAALGAAVSSVVGVFLIYKGAVIANTVATEAWTGATLAAQWTAGTFSGLLDALAVSAYTAAGGVNSIGMAIGGMSLKAATGVAGLLGLGELLLLNSLKAKHATADTAKLTKGIRLLADGATTAKAALAGSAYGFSGLVDDLKYLEDGGAGGFWDKLKETTRGKSPWDAFTGSDAKQARANIDATDKALAALLATGDKKGADKAYRDVKDALVKAGVSADFVRQVFDDYHGAAKDAADATDETGAAADKAAPKVKTLAEKWDDVASSVDKATEKLDILYGRTTSGIEARIEANAALMELTAGLKENGGVLNENTKAGQENYTNAIKARDAALAYAESLAKTGDIQGAIRYLTDYGKVLGNQADAAGLSKKQTADLIKTLGLTPEQVVIAFGSSGYKEAKQEAIDLTNHANTAAAKRFLNWVANTKDPERKARELGKIADDVAAKRFLDWYANTATAQDKVDVFFADLARKPKNFWVNVNAQITANGQRVPAFASGTSYAPGGLALVGEKGPELVDLPQGSKVYTAAATTSMTRPVSGTTAVMDRPVSIAVYLDGEQIEATVRRRAQDREARSGKSWLG